jgi:putative hydrolase of the HAD superfamily
LIKHLSFDLWLTLIKSNTQFKQKRAEYFACKHNPKGHSTEFIFNSIQCIDRASDRLNEMNGKKLSTECMYRAILKRLGHPDYEITNALLEELKNKLNALFLLYSPALLNDHIYKMLNILKDEGYSMNISSNTGFIEGDYVQIILKKLQIDHFFDFAIYSDQINASKPSARFFDVVYSQIKLKKHQVLHIGDNFKSDFIGASDFGFHALHIMDANYSIDYIKTKIDEKNRELQCI